MGSLGCPLCCQQDFGSVGALWDHLIYYNYRPLQCGVCCLHLEGIQEFMLHLKCHMGDGMPATAKFSCPKAPLPPGGESNVLNSPPPTNATAQESAAADPDAGIGSAQLSDGFSTYMKGGDAANQLLKLREWQLEKWGKNFIKHRASFGKSPGVLELSPASGKMHRGSPPASARDLVRECRPSSQISCYTPRSDALSLGRSVDSVERFDSSATPLSVSGNISSSVDVSDRGVCPQSVGKEASEEIGLHSPAQPVSASYGPHCLPSEQTAFPLKAVGLATSLKHNMPSSPLITGAELLPKNLNFLGCVPPESSESCDINMSQQPRSVTSPSFFVLSAQEVASCSLPPSRNELQDLQEYNVCGTEYAKHSNKSSLTQNDVLNIESCETSNKLPLLGTVDSDEFSADVCSPPKQYHELQPIPLNKQQLQAVTATREESQPLTINKEHRSVNVNEEQPQPVTLNRELQSATVNEKQPQPATVDRKHQSVTAHEEHPQPVVVDRGHQSVTVNERHQPVNVNRKNQSVTVNEQPLLITVNREYQSVTSNEEEPQPVPVNRELLQSATLNREQHQLATFDREERHSEVACGISDLWASYPSNSSPAGHIPSEVSNKVQQQNIIADYMSIDSNFSDIQGNLNNKSSVCSYWSTNCGEEGNLHIEIINSMTTNVNLDNNKLHETDTWKKMRRGNTHIHDENTNALQYSGYEDQAAQEGGCEEIFSSSTDTKPYLHKKFHHDQERKVLSSGGVDQVTDVSQYINSFQSVLVRKLNGTLSSVIPVTSNICPTSMKKPEKEISQEDLEQPHQSQAKEHTCEVCCQKYKNLSSLMLHCKEHKKEGENSCTKNLYRKCTKDSSEGKSRKKVSFQCDQCSKVFPKAFNFGRHMREVHAIKKSFVCLQCNKAFSSKRHLQEHSGIHKGEKAHECPHCHHMCYTPSGLRTHIQEIHSNMEQRVYCCDICGEKFAKVYGLKRHKQRKHTKQQLTCHICSKIFSCKEDMNKHSRTHIGVGTVKCDNCDKTFTTSWALQRHSKTHQDSPKSFTCSICSFTFTRKDSLISHLNAHSQKKPFVCHCGKRFVKKSQLKEHQDKHSNVPKYTCSVCKHSFKFRVSLKNHSCKKKENLKTID